MSGSSRVVAPACIAASQTLTRIVGVGAGGVLGGELDVVAVGAREGDHLGDLFEGLGACDLELGGEVKVGGGEEGVDAGAGGGLDGAGGGLMSSRLARAREAMMGPRSTLHRGRCCRWIRRRPRRRWRSRPPGCRRRERRSGGPCAASRGRT